jgi:hypothetical protein
MIFQKKQCTRPLMCATKFSITNWCDAPSGDGTFSPIPGNTVRSGYRVLRGSSRGELRSVDRNHAGRNAKPEGSSVKGLSPVKLISSWWPSKYGAAKATPKRKIFIIKPVGTTGVRDHGMHERQLEERWRSPSSRARQLRLAGRSLNAKSAMNFFGEVRCLHSSDEVE